MTKPGRRWKGSANRAGIDLRDDTGLEPVYGISRFIPVWGDDVLPEKPLDALTNGAGNDIEVLIGTNAEEMNLYFVPTKVRAKAPGWLLRWLLSRSHPRAKEALRAYGWGKERKAGDVFTEALTDLVFRWPARRFAEEHQGKTHVYEFDWQSPACGGELGASHGMELPFVFKTLTIATGPKGFAGENPATGSRRTRSQRSGCEFATDGSLPWPEFDREQRRVLPAGRQQDDLRAGDAGRRLPSLGTQPCISRNFGWTVGSPSSPAARRASAWSSPTRWPRPVRTVITERPERR